MEEEEEALGKWEWVHQRIETKGQGRYFVSETQGFRALFLDQKSLAVTRWFFVFLLVGPNTLDKKDDISFSISRSEMERKLWAS